MPARNTHPVLVDAGHTKRRIDQHQPYRADLFDDASILAATMTSQARELAKRFMQPSAPEQLTVFERANFDNLRYTPKSSPDLAPDTKGKMTSDLSTLEDLVARTLRDLKPRPEPWVPRTSGIDHDVLIVGAGQSGITAAFALDRLGIDATIIDAEPEGGEGVWLNRARMPTLRTPKNRPGPELGIAPLAFKAWFVALNGESAYDDIVRIPRTIWAEYLSWFRRTVNIPVRFGTRLVSVAPAGPNLRVTLDVMGQTRHETTRKLVLASGLVGGGRLNIPALVTDNLPRHLFAHTNDTIDFRSLEGRDVGILGASASGFDAAATALEAGAASAHLFCRANDLAHGTRYRWADYPGADYFHLLPDRDRWRVAGLYLERGNHPPANSIARVAKATNFHLHLGEPWTSAETRDTQALIGTGAGRYAFDFVITATGFAHDPARCPELSPVAGEIALWRDRYTPPPEARNEVLARYPYLGAEFQYQEKSTGAAPYIRNIHVLNTAALLSHLRIVGDIKCLGFVSRRLAGGIARDLFLADREAHIECLSGPANNELTGAEYAHLVWPRET